MNLSGKAVGAMASFYRIQPDEILVALTSWISLRAWRNLNLAAATAATMV